jgi:stalled ribosome rescue protein Dom34
LLLTDMYLAKSRQKQRIHRLLQIAKNKKIKTKVIDAETSAGCRITQFGGLVFFATK